MHNKLIKKLLVTSLLLGTVGNTFAGIYIGIDIGRADNESKTKLNDIADVTVSNDFRDVSIKLGQENDDKWKTQIKISRIFFANRFSNLSEKKLTELGVDFIKEFKAADKLYPFVKFGAGFGVMKVNLGNKTSIREHSFSGGAGLSYKLNEHLSLLGGVDYISRYWHDIEMGSMTVSVHDSGIKAYVGLNYMF